MTVHADVLQVFPIGDFDVTVSAAAPIERFVAAAGATVSGAGSAARAATPARSSW